MLVRYAYLSPVFSSAVEGFLSILVSFVIALTIANFRQNASFRIWVWMGSGLTAPEMAVRPDIASREDAVIGYLLNGQLCSDAHFIIA